MEPELVTYFTPLCVMLIMLTCCLRFAIKGCLRRSNQMNEFYTTQYCSGSSHQCSRVFMGDRGGVRGVVITRVPATQQSYPQIMGYVLDASLLSPVPQLEMPPSPPRYEEALKPMAAPPKYEESYPAYPPSNVTTARLESVVDETSQRSQTRNEVLRRYSEGDCWMTTESGGSDSSYSAR